MSLFDDDPLDALEYSDDSDEEEEPAPPAAAPAAAAPSAAAAAPAAAATPAPAPAPAPAEEGVPPGDEVGGSMFDQDPLADLGMETDESLGSRMKGLSGSFSAGIRSRSSSDAAQRVRGLTAAASTKAQETAMAAQGKAKAATETLAATVRQCQAGLFVRRRNFSRYQRRNEPRAGWWRPSGGRPVDFNGRGARIG